MITDAVWNDGYPLPLLLGFCRKDQIERNFATLLCEGAKRFDYGFYCTYGNVSGEWPLALLALLVLEGYEQPRWDLLDPLFTLDDELLATMLEEGPRDPGEFLARLHTIVEDAKEVGFGDDVWLSELLNKKGFGSLAEVEMLLSAASWSGRKSFNRSKTLWNLGLQLRLGLARVA